MLKPSLLKFVLIRKAADHTPFGTRCLSLFWCTANVLLLGHFVLSDAGSIHVLGSACSCNRTHLFWTGQKRWVDWWGAQALHVYLKSECEHCKLYIYVHVYIYIYIYIYACMYVCVCVCAHIGEMLIMKWHALEINIVYKLWLQSICLVLFYFVICLHQKTDMPYVCMCVPGTNILRVPCSQDKMSVQNIWIFINFGHV